MPGVQKPHWMAPDSTNASWIRCGFSGVPSPSVVTMSAPSRRATLAWQARVASPFTRTVHVPHCPLRSQDCLTLVSLCPSRSRSIRSRSESTTTCLERPLILKLILFTRLSFPAWGSPSHWAVAERARSGSGSHGDTDASIGVPVGGLPAAPGPERRGSRRRGETEGTIYALLSIFNRKVKPAVLRRVLCPDSRTFPPSGAAEDARPLALICRGHAAMELSSHRVRNVLPCGVRAASRAGPRVAAR